MISYNIFVIFLILFFIFLIYLNFFSLFDLAFHLYLPHVYIKFLPSPMFLFTFFPICFHHYSWYFIKYNLPFIILFSMCYYLVFLPKHWKILNILRIYSIIALMVVVFQSKYKYKEISFSWILMLLNRKS